MTLHQIERFISCPTDWNAICANGEFQYWLRFEWYLEVRRNQVDGEATLLDAENCEFNDVFAQLLCPEDLEPLVKNITSWHQRAADRYLSRTRRFRDLKVATVAEYPKHYASLNSSDADVSALSRHGDSVLYPRFSPAVQKHIVWAALRSVIDDRLIHHNRLETFHQPTDAERSLAELLFDRSKLKIYVSYFESIGCSDEQATNYGCLDFDFSTPTVHFYPVTYSMYQAAEFTAIIEREDVE